VFSQELEGLGDMVESLEVLVGEDKLHGTLATLRIKPAQGAAHAKIEARVADILGRHTVRYQVEFCR
jgi:fatty-acyl-CoA synthase